MINHHFYFKQQQQQKLGLSMSSKEQQQQQQSTTSANSNSTSSMSSTPTSSASQSPPSSKTTTNAIGNDVNNSELSQMAVDLSKAYYSRDEVMRAIESLKDRYLKESTSPSASALEAAIASKTTTTTPPIPTTPNSMQQQQLPASSGTSGNGSRLPNMAIVREIESLNGKLRELQGEISRLTLLQNRYDQQQGNGKSVINRASVVLNSEVATDKHVVDTKLSSNELDGLSQQPGL